MSEIGYSASKTASKIGEKLVEILDIFDLSFFMSGAVAMSAMLVYLDPPRDLLFRHTGMSIFGLVLGSYVFGLICFAVGRWIRSQPWMGRLLKAEPSHVVFHTALIRQGLTDEQGELLHRYFGHRVDEADPSMRMTMYTRMWVHVRSFPELSDSFALLKRYWILAASYDGVAVAMWLWLIPAWTGLAGEPRESPWPWVWTVAMLGAGVFCWHRAMQYKRYQIEELVATTAHWLTLVGRSTLAELASGPGEAEASATVTEP